MTTRKVLLGTAAALWLAAGPAVADCAAELAELNRDLSSPDNNYGAVLTGAAAGHVRDLRDAARIFAANGMDDRCEEVVEGIRDMLDQRTAQWKSENQSFDRNAWSTSQSARIKAAQPVTALTAPLRADDVIGADVRNMSNETLGEIEDVVLNLQQGGIGYAIVSFGGFLGMGKKQVAVPWSAFRVTPESDVFVLNITETAFRQAPSFERDDWVGINEATWRAENERYWKENVAM